MAVKHEGDVTVLVFEQGLFGARTVLTPAAGGTLDALAAKLRGDFGEFIISVTGHTDDLPMPPGGRFVDNVSLGLARATAVAERLRRAADLHAGSLGLRSLGSDDPPFPNDSPEGRRRNRTVVIRITQPAAPGTGK